MKLALPAPGTCPTCSTEHEPDQPHNAQSMYYKYRFYGIRGRWPTWSDALAHCDEQTRENWERELRVSGNWTELDDGDPVADPPDESFRQSIGDVSQPGFWPEFDPAVSGVTAENGKGKS